MEYFTARLPFFFYWVSTWGPIKAEGQNVRAPSPGDLGEVSLLLQRLNDSAVSDAERGALGNAVVTQLIMDFFLIYSYI